MCKVNEHGIYAMHYSVHFSIVFLALVLAGVEWQQLKHFFGHHCLERLRPPIGVLLVEDHRGAFELCSRIDAMVSSVFGVVGSLT